MKTLKDKASKSLTLEELKTEIQIYQFELEKALQLKKYKNAVHVTESLARTCKLAMKRQGF